MNLEERKKAWDDFIAFLKDKGENSEYLERLRNSRLGETMKMKHVWEIEPYNYISHIMNNSTFDFGEMMKWCELQNQWRKIIKK